MPTKSTLLAATLLCGSLGASAQKQYDIETETKWVNGTNLEISAVKHTVGSYTVMLRFTERENTRQPPTFKTVMRGSNQKLLTVMPINAEQPVRCRYSYTYVRGYRSPKLDSAFVYRLPYSVSHEPVAAAELFNLTERYFEGKPVRGWKAWQFNLNEGDTVFAMRKGLVVEVHDGEEPAQAGLQSTYRTKNNHILIEQPDGTLCQYSVLENGSITVKPGDAVYPGTPLGKAGAYYEGGERQVRTIVYFPDENRDYREGDPHNGSQFEWVYYNPWFATSEGNTRLTNRKTYKAVESPELVQKEMTKKEIKQYAAE